MATTGVAFLTVAAVWDRLQPSRPMPRANEMHGKLKPSTTFAKGQVLFYNPTAKYWDKAVAGAATGVGMGPRERVLGYPVITDTDGNAYLGNNIVVGDPSFESMPMFVGGPFFVKDLVGIGSDAELAELGQRSQGGAWDDTDPLAEVTLRGGGA